MRNQISLAFILQIGVVMHPAMGQTLNATKETVPRDSLPRPIHPGPLFLLKGAIGVALLVVAPPLLVTKTAQDTTELDYWRNHWGASATAGAFFYPKHQAPAHAINVEFLRKGMYSELRLEDFYLSRHVEYQTIRFGYLFHPIPGTGGGVMAGYRRAPGYARQEGLEIGLPLFVGVPGGTIRYEASYLIKPRSIQWNYRCVSEFAPRDRQLFYGFSLEGRSFTPDERSPRADVTAGAVSVLVGRRF